MKRRIYIDVEVPDLLHVGTFKNVFHLVKDMDDCIDFDFKSVLKGLACCFLDNGTVISFKVCP